MNRIEKNLSFTTGKCQKSFEWGENQYMDCNCPPIIPLKCHRDAGKNTKHNFHPHQQSLESCHKSSSLAAYQTSDRTGDMSWVCPCLLLVCWSQISGYRAAVRMKYSVSGPFTHEEVCAAVEFPSCRLCVDSPHFQTLV